MQYKIIILTLASQWNVNRESIFLMWLWQQHPCLFWLNSEFIYMYRFLSYPTPLSSTAQNPCMITNPLSLNGFPTIKNDRLRIYAKKREKLPFFYHYAKPSCININLIIKHLSVLNGVTKRNSIEFNRDHLMTSIIN